MDGDGRILIGVGADIQSVEPMRRALALQVPDVFFTRAECARAATSADAAATYAGMFCAKEAVFKACGRLDAARWTDIEVAAGAHGAPAIGFRGELGRAFAARGWRAAVSISHSGDYALAIVVIVADGGRR